MELNKNFSYAYEVEGGFAEVSEGLSEESFRKELNNDGFNVVFDGSIKGCQGIEREVVVDGYDYGEPAISRHSRLIKKLDKYGYNSNSSCGVHIHIGQKGGFTYNELLKISKVFLRFEEEVFYNNLHWLRREGDFSIPLKQSKIKKKFVKYIKEAKETDIRLEYYWYQDDPDKRKTNKYDLTRYTGLNLHRWFRSKKSIEFRYFDSRPELIPSWMEVLTKMLEFAINSSVKEIESTKKKEFMKLINIEKIKDKQREEEIIEVVEDEELEEIEHTIASCLELIEDGVLDMKKKEKGYFVFSDILPLIDVISVSLDVFKESEITKTESGVIISSEKYEVALSQMMEDLNSPLPIWRARQKRRELAPL